MAKSNQERPSLDLDVLSETELQIYHAGFQDGSQFEKALAQARIARLEKQRNFHKRLASLDPLTGLGNRRAISPAFMRARRSGRPFTVIYKDFVGQGKTNQICRHEVGDNVLRHHTIAVYDPELAATIADFRDTKGIKKALRKVKPHIYPDDAFVRWGGDEFIDLLLLKSADEYSVAKQAALADTRINGDNYNGNAQPAVVQHREFLQPYFDEDSRKFGASPKVFGLRRNQFVYDPALGLHLPDIDTILNIADPKGRDHQLEIVKPPNIINQNFVARGATTAINALRQRL